MPQLELHRVGAAGRINLGDLTQGVDYYQADKNDEGVITLTPVSIVPATGKRSAPTTTTASGETVAPTADGDTPWDEQ